MTEGHPAFVANNGRIGFGLDDYAAYAPETGSDVRLVWLAARREHTRLSLGAGLSEEDLYAAELDPHAAGLGATGAATSGSTRPTTCCCRCTRGSGGTRSRSRSRPTWPAATWCSSARGRTTTARSSRSAPSSTPADPERHYVKTALSIQNMGFMRGLSPTTWARRPRSTTGSPSVVDGRPDPARLRVHGAARAGRDRLHRRRVPRAARAAGRELAVPEDDRRALARVADAPARPRRAADDDGGPAAPRRRRPFAGGRADRGVGRRRRCRGCAATCTPTCGRSCTACSPTTWRSCRTARTWCWCCATGCRCGR